MDVGMYERALQRTGAVVAGTTKEQLDNPTPCTEWTVRDVLNHVIGGCLAFAAGASGEGRPFDDGADHTAEDHVGEFDRAAKVALEAFNQTGALEKEFSMSWGKTPGPAALGLAVADAVVHGWDLAQGTGRSIQIDEDIAAELYATTIQMMEPKGSYPRGDSFKEPVEVPDDASSADKLIAYLGRRP